MHAQRHGAGGLWRGERNCGLSCVSGVARIAFVRIVDDFGEHRIQAHGLTTSEVARETYSIHPDDPLSARAEIYWTEMLYRGDWRVRTETRTKMWADRDYFFIRAKLEAFEGEHAVFVRSWDRRIPRDMT